MVLGLQPGQRKLPLKAIFRKLDQDDSGALERAEIRRLMEVMGRMLTNAEFEKAWAEMDTDNSGEVHFDEFEQWFYRTQDQPRRGREARKKRPKKDLRRSFRTAVKKASVLAIGGYRAMLSDELKAQVRVMSKRPEMRTKKEIEQLQPLRSMNFLAVLPPATLDRVLRHISCTAVAANTVILEEGEEGADKMYMIMAGSVSLYNTHVLHGDLMAHVADLGPREHFGDEALVLRSTERPFTVEAREETILITLSRDHYEQCCKTEFEGAQTLRFARHYLSLWSDLSDSGLAGVRRRGDAQGDGAALDPALLLRRHRRPHRHVLRHPPPRAQTRRRAREGGPPAADDARHPRGHGWRVGDAACWGGAAGGDGSGARRDADARDALRDGEHHRRHRPRARSGEARPCSSERLLLLLSLTNQRFCCPTPSSQRHR